MSQPAPNTTCQAQVFAASGFEFSLKNRLKVRNFIWGVLDDDGELYFWVENLPKDGTGCPGHWMFAELMAHFGDRVSAIRGDWDHADNLTAVNRLTASGVSLESAAVQTPTGKYAAAHGYRNVAVVLKNGNAGAYTSVSVRFRK
jgi:hypothetical protein